MTWDEVRKQLYAWAKEPGRVDEDGYRSPTAIALVLAAEWLVALECMSQECRRIAPDGDGGLAIDWGIHQSSLFLDDGEEVRVIDGKVVARVPLDGA